MTEQETALLRKLADDLDAEARRLAGEARGHYAALRFKDGGKVDACGLRLSGYARRARVAAK